MTCNEDIASDVNDLFVQITGLGRASKLKYLLSSPFTLQPGMVERIAREAGHARAGKPAQIIAKMNALLEPGVIDLYQASQAGVKIQLIVRGVCALRPGVPGLSDNISVRRSIVGRFLEHSRIFYFGNDGDEELFIASADWMGRNFFRRIETCVPILDRRIRQRIIKEGLKPYLADNMNAWEMDSDGNYRRRTSRGKPHCAQLELLGLLAHGPVKKALMITFLWIAGCLLVLLGWWVPSCRPCPGLPILFAGSLLIAWAGDFQQVGTIGLVILGVLAVLGSAVDFVAGLLGAKVYGASHMALWGSLAALSAYFPVAGAVAGAVAGRSPWRVAGPSLLVAGWQGRGSHVRGPDHRYGRQGRYCTGDAGCAGICPAAVVRRKRGARISGFRTGGKTDAAWPGRAVRRFSLPGFRAGYRCRVGLRQSGSAEYLDMSSGAAGQCRKIVTAFQDRNDAAFAVLGGKFAQFARNPLVICFNQAH